MSTSSIHGVSGVVSAEKPAGEVVFPEQKAIEPCSKNVCSAGHSWPITIAVAKCPGCSSAVLAVKMEQCPICNEPAIRTKIRTDYLPSGGPITKRCQGQAHPCVVTEEIEIERTHAEETESKGKG